MNVNKLKGFFADYWLLGVLIIIGGLLLFFGGEWLGDRWASSRHAKQLEETLKQSALNKQKADEAIAREAVLGEKNKILREVNEKQAKLLTEHGNAELAKGAENLEKVAKEKADKLDAIAETPDSEQKKQLCEEAKAAGIMFDFCAPIVNG